MAKKIPMRRCVVSHEQCPKNELLRVVRTPEGSLAIDVTGRMNGRGAYLKKDAAIVEKAMKTKALERALQTEIDDAFYDELKKSVL